MKDKTKRILFVSNYKKSVGGISGQVDLLNHCLKKENIETAVFGTKANCLIRPFLVFVLFVKARKYDILHIHGCSYIGGFYPIIIGTVVGKLLKKKTIVTYHGSGADTYFEKHRKLIGYIFSLADEITVQSRFLEKVFLKYGMAVNVIPNILELDISKFKLRDNIRPILIVTRSLTKVYNVKCAIYAFDIVKKKYPDSKLIIVGDGPEMENLKNLVKTLKLTDVVFKGRVPNTQIYDELNEADIFTNPTTKDNMPVSILEAFACGLPVVSTNVGGIPYVIEDHSNGLLVDNNDHQGMARKIVELIENYELSKELILNGIESLKKYKWESVKSRWYNLYEVSNQEM